MSILIAIVSFAAVICFLVFIHELGHYLVARWNGVHVHTFSVGMGPTINLFGYRLERIDKNGTLWRMAWLPIGGYVMMAGAEEIDPQTGKMQPSAIDRGIDPQNYYGTKSPWQRMAIAVAGPLANFLFAIVAFAAIFFFNGEVKIAAVIGDVTPDSPAAVAGLQTGDKVVELNGQAVEDYQNMRIIVALNPEQTMPMVVLRDGEQVELSITPARLEKDGTGYIGVGISGEYESIEHGVFSATWRGVEQTANMTVLQTVGIYKIITGQMEASKSVAGPIGIAQMAGESTQNGGLMGLLGMTIMFSIVLGYMNLLPIPVLE